MAGPAGNPIWSHLFDPGRADREQGNREVELAREAMLVHWALHPWNWLTGRDITDRSDRWPEGRPIIWTQDEGEGDATKALKPWPEDYWFMYQYVQLLWSPAIRYFLVEKSRQLMATTGALLVMDWFARFQPNRRMLVSRTKEEDATELLRDKVRSMHSRLPAWVQSALPQGATPATRVPYPDTGSYILGVPQNVATSTARGGTSTIVLVDEAAYQEMFEEILTACLPMAWKIWALTTPNIGNAGAKTFMEYKNEGLVERAQA